MNIAIAGYGVEGKVSYEYWASQHDAATGEPLHHVTIVSETSVDDAPVDAVVVTGDDAFTKLNGFDLVVRTAGLAPHKITTDGKIWSATNEFFEKCPAQIIGVTGSKGKGTTASLIASILEAAGKKVWLVGNIGVASLSVLSQIRDDDIVVYELSSFQLWDIERSPNVAVVLHIEPDHLDVHFDFDDYVNAKAAIARYQITTDRVVYNANNQWSTEIAMQSVGQRLPYPTERGAHVKDDYFYYGDVEVCNTDNLMLPGVHNLDNTCAAITAVWPWVQAGAVIAEGLRAFDGLPHRLKFVRELDGVSFYDDSIATTPGSALAAVAAFPESKVLILGGSYKGADFTQLAEKIAHPASNVKHVLIIGDEAKRIAAALDGVGYGAYSVEGASFAEIIERAYQLAKPSSTVILSPACASFGQFKNYADRGDQFITAVSALS